MPSLDAEYHQRRCHAAEPQVVGHAAAGLFRDQDQSEDETSHSKNPNVVIAGEVCLTDPNAALGLDWEV